MTAKAKAGKKAKPKHPVHSVTRTHGHTRITVTTRGHEKTTVRSVSHGGHRTTTTTVERGGKVIRKSVVRSLIHHGGYGKGGKKGAKRGTPGLLARGSPWITGCNDLLDTCVPVALANSYLIATGRRIPDAQILALAGVRSIEDVLSELGAAFRPAEYLADGVILGLPGAHAGVYLDGAVVSWGAETELPGEIEEAWEPLWNLVTLR